MLSQDLPRFVLDFFTLLNIVCLIISGASMFYLLKNKTYLIVKPSFIFFIYCFVFLQIPFVYFSYECEVFLPSPYTFLLFFYSIIFSGLLASSLTFKKASKNVWKNLTRTSPIELNLSISLFAFVLTFLCLLIYASGFNLLETPLVKFINGESAKSLELSREYSLKTLDSSYAKYAYSIARSCFIIFIIGYSSFNLVEYIKLKQYKYASVCFFLILFAVLFSMIVLNKSSVILSLFPILFNFIYMKITSLYKSIFILILGFFSAIVGFVLLIASVFSTQFNFLLSLKQVCIRAFLIQFRVGIWYAQFAQKFDNIGIVSYAKLSHFFENETINVPNFIGKLYSPIYYHHDVLGSVNCNASFIFCNYLAWGFWGLPLVVLMIISLDVGLKLLENLKKEYLIPFLSITALNVLALISSDYGVTMITHGYLISFIVLYVFLKLDKYLSNSNLKLKSYQIIQKV